MFSFFKKKQKPITPKEFIQSCMVTQARDFTPVFTRLKDVRYIKLMHAAMGIGTEGGEFQDAIKKCIFYGKPIDTVNLVEELGDIMWYIAIACDTLGVDLEEVMQKNSDKIHSRYAGGFSEEKAQKRNLEKERKILED